MKIKKGRGVHRSTSVVSYQLRSNPAWSNSVAHRTILCRERIIFISVFPICVRVFAGAMCWKEWPYLVVTRTKAQPFADFVRLGPQALIEYPASP